MEKTIADELTNIPNADKQNYPLYRLELLIEKSGHN